MKFIHLTPAALVFVQLGALAIGMASWLDDDEDGGDSGGDDEFAVDDGDAFDDDFDDEFGSFDEMDGGGGGAGNASVNELEHRLEELETEVSNVASKANTVRSENEQISESVEDVEENVRKLLEIYEMVTRGVNPFVDDVNADAMGGGGAQSFGLFDDEDDGEDDEAEAELDADIAEADADDFFEDDAFDDAEFEDADDLDDEFGDFDDDEDAARDADLADEETDADGEGGTSFEELKAEYESGEADWTGDDDTEAVGDGDSEPGNFGNASDADDGLGFDESDLASGEDAASGEDQTDYGGFEFGPETVDERGEAGVGGPGAPSIGLADRGDGPHLAEPPTGYLADVVALEWLDHLLSEFGARNTVRTLNYYKRIGWIGEPVRDQLFDYLEGLTDSDYLYRDEFGTTELTMDDHMESLDYIDELASENIERAIVDRFDDLHTNGIQR